MYTATEYSDEVIKILTNGIGGELGKPIRFRYYELKEKLLNRLRISRDLNNDDAQIAIDVIALSVFYQRLIVPFYGSSNFLERLNSHAVSSVLMGSYILGEDDRNKMRICTRAFYAILKKLELSPSTLDISSIEELIATISSPRSNEESFDNE
jgi:hypothetical protein